VSEQALLVVLDPRPDEAELVERAKRGDHDAYAELVRDHQAAAFRVAYLVAGGSAADAEDVAQEAFVKAYRSLERFRAGAPFRPWLLRIVGNEARNHRRAAGRRAYHQGRAAALEPVAGAPPEDEVLGREGGRAVRAALDRLPHGERVAVAARYLVGLTDSETAAALGIPRATVKMRAWRGLNRLRRELGEEGP
jgi:RNA polymerase sigma-70 factor (ECF subfamily)